MRRERGFIGPQSMGGVVSLWGATSIVRSVQRGSIALGGGTSATSTISSVDVNNSLLYYLGNKSASLNISASQIRMELTNATTITAVVGGASGSQSGVFEIVEFATGVIKSVQRGTITVSGASATETIQAVNTQRAVLICLGMTTNSASVDEGICGGELTDSTTITVTRTTSANQVVYGYQVVEWY